MSLIIMCRPPQASHMSYLHAFYGVDVASGPFVMAVALSLYTWCTGMIIVGAGLLMIALLIAVSFPLWKEETAPVEETPDIKTFNALRSRGVKWSIMIFTVAVHAESFIGLFVATYAYVDLGFGLAESALATVVFYGGLTAGRVLSRRVASKVNANHLIIAGQLLMGSVPSPWHFLTAHSSSDDFIFPHRREQWPVYPI
jgi:hypothetical protein